MFSLEYVTLGVNSNDCVPKKILLARKWVELKKEGGTAFYGYEWLEVEPNGSRPYRILGIKLFQGRRTVELHVNGEFVEALPLYNYMETINVTNLLRMIDSGNRIAKSRGWI